jgi:hypothetical protein
MKASLVCATFHSVVPAKAGTHFDFDLRAEDQNGFRLSPE